MKQHRILTVTSLFSAALFSFHWADEIARGIEPGTLSSAGGLLILFVWSYAALMLVARWWGLVVVLAAALLASVVPLLHMQGAGLVGKRIAANSPGAYFWVWTNIALGVSGLVSAALAVQSLWALRQAARGGASRRGAAAR